MSITTKNLLGYDISTNTIEAILNNIINLIQEEKPCHIVTINPEIIELANKNQEFKKAVKQADILIPDGVGIVLGFKLKGINIQRTPGIELSERLIQKAEENHYKIGMIGASNEVVEVAKNNLKAKFPNLQIAFSSDGFFNKEEEQELVKNIKYAKVQVLFIAMGIPKQEIFINKYKNELNRTIMIGVGGSFDVWANKVQRAPELYQKLGLEWFYRLLTQPSRFSRMFPTLPIFLIKVILSILKGDNS